MPLRATIVFAAALGALVVPHQGRAADVRHEARSPGPTLQTLHSFSGADGAEPGAGILVDKSGVLFGTTEAGGTKNRGTVFTLKPVSSGYVETVLHVFAGGPSDGQQPVAPLIEDSAGNLYGTTAGGGKMAPKRGCPGQYLGCGTVFSLSPSASGYSERVVYAFHAGADDGDTPYGPVVINAQGALEGATSFGGADAVFGTIFTITSGRERVVFAFTVSSSGAPFPAGALPIGAIALRSDGTLFGSAPFGGTGTCPLYPVARCGVVYAIGPAGSQYADSTAYSFAGGSDGWYPEGGVTVDSHGAVYGTTELGGTANLGTVFKLTPNPSTGGFTESIIHSFAGGADGALPLATVVVDKDGVLYGTTSSGGSANAGTVYAMKPSGSGYSEHVVYTFSGGSDGGQPVAPLAFGKAGLLYGTTLSGGVYAGGTVFSVHK